MDKSRGSRAGDYWWSPVTGCYHGCSYCFARRVADRFGGQRTDGVSFTTAADGRSLAVATKKAPFPAGFVPTFYPYRLNEPRRIKMPASIFVSDVGDLWGEWVPDAWIEAVLEVARACPQHTFLMLTKNPGRYSQFSLPDNCWPGTTAEDQWALERRVPQLLRANATVYWLSGEPLLGEMDPTPWMLDEPPELTYPDLDAPDGAVWGRFQRVGSSWEEVLPRLSWLVAGGQTGTGAQPLNPYSLRTVRNVCVATDTPFYFKGWGDWGPVQETLLPGEMATMPRTVGARDVMWRCGKKRAGRELDGRTWEQMPAAG